MNIVIGCPVSNRGWIIPEWFQAIETQGIDVTVVCILSASEDDTEALLKERGIYFERDSRPGRTTAEVDGHCWGLKDTYGYMASMRNRLIEIAQGFEADYFCSLDSDIILPPNGLQQLLDYAETHPGIVAPAVNMTINGVAMNRMDWITPGSAGRITQAPTTGPADVVMAAMLLDQEGMKCRWEAHPQGEDIGFSWDADKKSIPRWWVAEVKCPHLMRKF